VDGGDLSKLFSSVVKSFVEHCSRLMCLPQFVARDYGSTSVCIIQYVFPTSSAHAPLFHIILGEHGETVSLVGFRPAMWG